MKFERIFTIIVFFMFLFILYEKYNDKEKIVIDPSVKIYETICGKYKKGEIRINQNILFVDIADDNCKTSLGLSGRASLDGEGMLFIFENVGNYGFWMKDMNFPIDILWIDDKFEVVGIEKNLSPDTFPKSFGSNYLVKYVLEVPAQYSDKNNIKIGDNIIFELK